MKDTELIDVWKSYNKKLEDSLAFNSKNAEDITMIKTGSLIMGMKPLKIFTVLIGIIWVVLVDFLIINLFNVASPFFLVSAGIQVLLTKLAIAVYVYQLVLMHNIDITAPVVTTQYKLAGLKSSTLWVTRLLFLQLPVWTTFYLNEDIFKNGNTWLYIIQIVLTVSFTYVSVWLFLNIRYENRKKKWFRIIFSGKEWDPLMKSIDMLSQLDEYKKQE